MECCKSSLERVPQLPQFLLLWVWPMDMSECNMAKGKKKKKSMNGLVPLNFCYQEKKMQLVLWTRRQMYLGESYMAELGHRVSPGQLILH